MIYYYTNFSTPFGRIYALKTETGLKLLTFSKKELENQLHKLKMKNEKLKNNKLPFFNLKKELLDYFSGKKVSFSEKLDLSSGTEFQKKVWRKMRKIPYGQKRSYKWLAQRVGDFKKARAVGNACGSNPFAIIIPCHRVVKEDGGLGGYSGGLWIKKKLLKLETKT